MAKTLTKEDTKHYLTFAQAEIGAALTFMGERDYASAVKALKEARYLLAHRIHAERNTE